jgi:hypothetical protein
VSFLLDTSVISELVKPTPDDNVVEWMKRADGTSLDLSVLIIGELEKGIAKQPLSFRRTKIETWVKSDLVDRFRERLLAIDGTVAVTWGTLPGGTKSGLSRDQVLLLQRSLEAQGIAALMAAFGRSSRTKFRDQVLNPLIEAGLPGVRPRPHFHRRTVCRFRGALSPAARDTIACAPSAFTGIPIPGRSSASTMLPSTWRNSGPYTRAC